MTQKQLNIVNKLSGLEDAVGRLYEVYAAIFPEYQEFWANLVTDEHKHAAWIRELNSLINNCSFVFNEGRFKIEIIEKFLGYLHEELEKAQARAVSLINALSITLYIEESLIEQRYFEVVEGDSPELKRVLLDLARDTQKHIALTRSTFNSYKAKAQ